MADQEFRIDVVIDPASSVRGSQRVSQQLAAIEADAAALKKALDDAMALRGSVGAFSTLARIDVLLGQTGANALQAGQKLQQLGRGIDTRQVQAFSTSVSQIGGALGQLDGQTSRASAKLAALGRGVDTNGVQALSGAVTQLDGQTSRASAKLAALGRGVDTTGVQALGGALGQLEGTAGRVSARVTSLGRGVDTSGVQALGGALGQLDGQTSRASAKIAALGRGVDTTGVQALSGAVTQLDGQTSRASAKLAALGRGVDTTGVQALGGALGQLEGTAGRAQERLARLSLASRGLTVGLDGTLAATAARAETAAASVSKIGRTVDVRGVRNVNAELAVTETRAAGVERLLKRSFAGVSAALLAREYVQLSDAVTNTENRLRLVTSSAAELASTQQRLLEIANQTRSSYVSTAEVFNRVALSAKTLGVSNAQLLEFTTSLNQAVILSGASAAEASAGLIQLSQGLASGALRGDELRSVLEQLPAVADVIAAGMKVSRDELRLLGEQGKISAKAVLDAFAAARGELAGRFATTIPTIGQALTVLGNKLTEAVGGFNKATGASNLLSVALLGVGNNVGALATALAVGLAAKALPAVIAGTAAATKALLALKLEAVAANAAVGGLALGGFLLFAKLEEREANLAAIQQSVAEVQGDLKNLSKSTIEIRQLQTEITRLRERFRENIEKGISTKDPTFQIETLTFAIKQLEEQRKKELDAAKASRQTALDSAADLKLQAEVLEKLRKPFEEYANTRKALDGLLAKGKVTIAEYNREIENLKPVPVSKEAERQAQILKDLRQPTIDYANAQKDLGELLAANKITQAEYNAELEKTPTGSPAADRQAKILADLRKPFADYVLAQKDLGELLAANKITQAEFNTALAQARNSLPDTAQTPQKTRVPLTDGQQKVLLDAELDALRAQNLELETRANNTGVIRDALLIENELTAQGVELNAAKDSKIQQLVAKRTALTKLVQEQAEKEALLLNIQNAGRDVVAELAAEANARDVINEKIRVLIALQQQEGVVSEEVSKKVLQLRAQQLQSATDLGSGFERAFIKLKAEAEDLAAVGEQLVDVFANRATEAITTLVTTGKINFKEFASALLADITRIITRLLIVKALSSISGVDSGTVNTGVQLGTAAAGANSGRARGGTVQAGQLPFMVGEDGPERFVPDRTGTIVPNAASVAAPAPQVNLKVVTLTDPNMVAGAIDDGTSDEAIVNLISRKRDAVRQLLS